MRTWGSPNQRLSHTYDTLRRPVGGDEILLGRLVYGDLLSTPEDTNHVGRVYRVYDGASAATTLEFGFKGSPSKSSASSFSTQPPNRTGVTCSARVQLPP